jgi:transposase
MTLWTPRLPPGVLAGAELGQSKSHDGAVEMIRTLRVARRSAMKART